MLLPMGIVTNRVYYELLNENSVALLCWKAKQQNVRLKKFCEGFSWHFGDFFLAAIFRDPTQDQNCHDVTREGYLLSMLM